MTHSSLSGVTHNTLLSSVQAIKALMPVFARFVASGQMPKEEAATTLLSPPTAHEEKVLDYFSAVLKCVAMPRNSKLLCTLPETVAQSQLLPVTGCQLTDARLLMQLLADKQCGKMLQKLLEWQNKLRKLLSDLISARSEVNTVRRKPGVACTVA
jgi:hypothetical protein